MTYLYNRLNFKKENIFWQELRIIVWNYSWNRKVKIKTSTQKIFILSAFTKIILKILMWMNANVFKISFTSFFSLNFVMHKYTEKMKKYLKEFLFKKIFSKIIFLKK